MDNKTTKENKMKHQTKKTKEAYLNCVILANRAGTVSATCFKNALNNYRYAYVNAGLVAQSCGLQSPYNQKNLKKTIKTLCTRWGKKNYVCFLNS